MTHDKGHVFDVADLSATLRETLSVRTVFGEAYEKGGQTVIPVASVCSAHGIGGGFGDSDFGAAISVAKSAISEQAADAEGADADSAPASGGGAGAGAVSYLRPVGAYVIEADGSVRWQPVIDPVMLAGIGAAVAALALIALPRTVRAIGRICGHPHARGRKRCCRPGRKSLG